ncbi:MAG: inositol monophosphatase [Alphaproteobacteria bacterium]|nr:inositol monophosphatase [Alphaproteobacteria bacterium]
MATRSALINVMVGAVFKTARKLLRDFNEVEQLQVSEKGPRDFVTTADITADRMLREMLGEARPTFGFLTEEGAATTGRDAGSRWIIDPLDGTLNYLHGLPHFAISVAAEVAGRLEAGVIYDPIRDELFWADRGRGAYLNERRLRVSARKRLQDALVGVGGPLHAEGGHTRYGETLAPLIEATASYRRSGSAALDLAYLAAGRFDGYWAVGLSAWDIAAGLVLIREAGGFVSEADGRAVTLSSRSIVAGNYQLHEEFVKIVKNR